jgi:hypothetical protein
MVRPDAASIDGAAKTIGNVQDNAHKAIAPRVQRILTFHLKKSLTMKALLFKSM